jgi:hypothetical protein
MNYSRTPGRFNDRSMALMGIPDLPEAAFGGDLPPMERKALVQAMGIRPQGGGGGGGLMAVVAVAAAIAIPIAAPAIASSIGMSAAIGTAIGSSVAGGVIGSAIVGAGLGAVTAAVTKQDLGRGALFGAIGGGIGGYGAATSAPTSTGVGTTTSATTAPAAVDLTGVAATPTGGITAGMTQAEMLAAQEAGFGISQQAQMLAAQDAGLGATLSSGAETAYGYAAPTAGLDTATAGVAGTTTGTTPTGTATTPTAAGGVSEQQAILNAQDAAVGATPSTATSAIGYSAPTQTTFGALVDGTTQAAKAVGSELTKKFSTPKGQAELLLKAAGQIAGSYATQSPEEQQLLDEARRDLEQLRSTNQQLFNEKLSAAQQMVQDANYFDPEYFGLQRARKTQIAGAQLERDTLAKIPRQRAGLRAAEQRRLRLGTSREAGTAYDTGFTGAIDAQNKSRTAGLNLYPTYSTNAINYGSTLATGYGTAEERARKSRESTGKFLSGLFS